jgi:hypothetical protein
MRPARSAGRARPKLARPGCWLRSAMPELDMVAASDSDRGSMNRSRFSFLSAVVLTTVILSLRIDHAAAQEVGLTPMEATELARGYRAETLKLKPVVTRKTRRSGESIISFSARTATFTLSLPSAILPDLVATSSLFPSVASNWTIPPATSYCPEPLVLRWRNYRFTSTAGEVAPYPEAPSLMR